VALLRLSSHLVSPQCGRSWPVDRSGRCGTAWQQRAVRWAASSSSLRILLAVCSWGASHEKTTPAQPTARARGVDLHHRRGDLRACFKLVGVSRHGDSETAPGVDARPEVLRPIARSRIRTLTGAHRFGLRTHEREWSAERVPSQMSGRYFTHHLASMAWLERCGLVWSRSRSRNCLT
jgi:hypothetical protein